MVALNSAMMTDGVVIEVADGAVADAAAAYRPYRQRRRTRGDVHALAAAARQIRARATLVESYIGAEGATTYQVHDSLILSIGDGARLDHVRLVEDSRDAFNISSSVVTLGAHAHFNTFGMTTRRAASAGIRPSLRSPARARRSRPTASIC